MGNVCDCAHHLLAAGYVWQARKSHAGKLPNTHAPLRDTKQSTYRGILHSKCLMIETASVCLYSYLRDPGESTCSQNFYSHNFSSEHDILCEAHVTHMALLDQGSRAMRVSAISEGALLDSLGHRNVRVWMLLLSNVWVNDLLEMFTLQESLIHNTRSYFQNVLIVRYQFNYETTVVGAQFPLQSCRPPQGFTYASRNSTHTHELIVSTGCCCS